MVLKDPKFVPVKALLEYFTQDFILKLPPWQREYSWEADDNGQVGRLLEDLKNFVEDDSQEEYLLGAIILCDDENEKHKLIIDGQQRTITLSILLFALNRYLTKSNLFDTSNNDHKHLISDLIRCTSFSKEGFSPRVIFNQPNANSILTNIRDWSVSAGDAAESNIKSQDTQSRTQKNLLDVANYLNDRISKSNNKWIDDDKLASSVIKILNKVKIIQLSIDKQQEAISIFDRINNRGLVLNKADLIKNQIFQKVTDTDFDEISSNWQDMTSTLLSSKSPRLSEAQYLLRSFAWTIKPKKTSYDQLLEFFVTGKDAYLNGHSPKEFSEELMYLAEDLVNFARLEHREHTTSKQLNELYIPQYLGSVQHFPVLLAGRKIKSLNAFSHLIHQVSMRTALYVFAQERPPIFESMIPVWANKIREAGDEITVEQLNEIYNNPENKIIPNPDLVAQLEKNIDDWNIENSVHKKKIRAALAFLSWYFDQYSDQLNISEYFRTRKKKGEKKGWDIDHILAINNDQAKIDQGLLHSFGNLVLLSPGDNRAQRDADIIIKKPNYAHSRLLLTQSLVFGDVTISQSDQKNIDKIMSQFDLKPEWNLDKWDQESIKARHLFYKKILIDLLTMRKNK